MREMKDSGIEWIGEIPEHWAFSRISSLYRLRSEKVSDRDYPPLSVTKSGILPQLDTVAKTDAHDDRKLVKRGDFVINSRSDRRGSCGISEYDGSVSLINTVLYPIAEMNPRYYNCFFHMNEFADEFYKWGHGIVDDLWTTRWQDMKNIVIIVPPVDEQERIAKFLDEKCTNIDSLISELKKQTETLEEYKQSVITETVTKGLNSDVEMKDSSVQWIEKIPKHWNTHPIYYYFEERKNKNSSGLENNLLSLSYGKIARRNINSNDGLLPESLNTYNIIEKDDIIIRSIDLQNDKRSLRTAIAKEHGIITSAYIAMKAAKTINPEYFHYLLYAYDIMKVFYNIGNGVRQGFNFSEFSRLIVFEPTIEEQNEMVTYLQEKCTEIDKTISEKKKQIKTIEQYKKSLIYEIVTGKKKL
ncbi:MAG: restriction endonuclease subunit S [Ruminococcus sp.]|nr:restriction endonuclease subunit S [Ruminococcus sp.]